jgi:hypothetical protein
MISINQSKSKHTCNASYVAMQIGDAANDTDLYHLILVIVAANVLTMLNNSSQKQKNTISFIKFSSSIKYQDRPIYFSSF